MKVKNVFPTKRKFSSIDECHQQNSLVFMPLMDMLPRGLMESALSVPSRCKGLWIPRVYPRFSDISEPIRS
jgi:hypothetical protein